MTVRKKLFIVDALNYLFRAYYAIRKMTNSKGASTNALYGFIRSLGRIQKEFTFDHMAIVFDGPDNKQSRLSIYEDYKGHRSEMPEDLGPQIALAKDYCDYASIPHLCVPGVEADDTMGSIAKWAEKQGFDVYLCSSDKDLCQLIDDHIFVLNIHKDNLLIDSEKVEELFGVNPKQIIDYLAIMGDSSDNIPGIRGFGAKTATELLQEFDTLENLLAHPEKLKSKKRQERLIEDKENALLSQQLATIQTDVNFPKKESFFKVGKANKKELKGFYEEMSFLSLLKDIEPEEKAISSKTEEKKAYHLVNSQPDLNKLISLLKNANEICIDTETTSLDPMKATLVGIGFGIKPNEAWYVPLNGDIDPHIIVEQLQPILKDTTKGFIGHNIKYDLHALSNHNLEIALLSFDTMIASYLLNAHSNRHSLDHLCLENFSKVKIAYSSIVGSGKKQIPLTEAPIEQVANYCCEDVDYTLRLKATFEGQLKERSLDELFTKMEMPLIRVLFAMERQGIYLDIKRLEEVSLSLRQTIDKLKKDIFSLANQEFNLNSPKQLSTVLFSDLAIKHKSKKTTKGYSTSADVLESLVGEHPIIEKIIQYRKMEKLRSTYADALIEQVNEKTNRIHCSFNQSVTSTGRLSSTNPNLQNIPVRTPEGRKIRSAFKPQKKGWSYLAADYSQIELRILAHLSQDPELVDAFNHDKDIHIATAASVFGVAPEKVTKQMRSRAKAVNFGLIYGQQAFGLAKELGIEFSEAREFIHTYFKKYPNVKAYLDKSQSEAFQKGFVTSIKGRQRLLPEINSKNGMIRSQANRIAINAPIQGSQSDIIKLAMIKIAKKLEQEKLESFLILQVHDELIFECPDSELAICEKLTKDHMETIVSLCVPLKVDISIGKNWEEC